MERPGSRMKELTRTPTQKNKTLDVSVANQNRTLVLEKFGLLLIWFEFMRLEVVIHFMY